MGFETYKGYDDPKELRRIQILSTMLMDELDRVCGELGISYQRMAVPKSVPFGIKASFLG